MNRKWLSLVLLIHSLAFNLQGQHKSTFVISEEIPIEVRGGTSYISPVKSSPDGQILVRFDPSIVTLISGDGKTGANLSLEQVPELSEADLFDFAGSAGSAVYLLAEKGDPKDSSASTVYVVRFDKDGRYSFTKLDNPLTMYFRPRQLAVFGTGDFFVSGFREDIGKPASYIFKDNGQLVKELEFKKDLSIQKLESERKRSKQQEGANEKPVDETFRDQIELSWAQSTEDGSVYLTRTIPSGHVFIISPGGTVQTVTLTPPEKEVRLIALKLDAGLIAAEYHATKTTKGEPSKCYISLIEVESGRVRETTEYGFNAQTTALGPVFYKDNILTYLGVRPDNRMVLVKAKLE